jgi:hypothetical protein
MCEGHTCTVCLTASLAQLRLTQSRGFVNFLVGQGEFDQCAKRFCGAPWIVQDAEVCQAFGQIRSRLSKVSASVTPEQA